MAARATPKPAPESAAEPATPPAPAEPEAPPLPLDEYPLIRCATIAASIARAPERRDAILKAQSLEPERWAALEQHHAAAIQEETQRGRSMLLSAYDGTYVKQLEAERGPIKVEDYARLVVAGERGAAASALTARGLPPGALLRIQRVWMRKLAGDVALAAAVRKELEAARAED